MLLVWTPTAKSSKDTIVRVLYTGACPQTVVFEALSRVRHLEFLNAFEQSPKARTSTIKTPSSTIKNVATKSVPNKPKPPVTNRISPSAVQSNTSKIISQPTNASKPKVSQPKVIKAEKPRSVPMTKKVINPNYISFDKRYYLFFL